MKAIFTIPLCSWLLLLTTPIILRRGRNFFPVKLLEVSPLVSDLLLIFGSLLPGWRGFIAVSWSFCKLNLRVDNPAPLALNLPLFPDWKLLMIPKLLLLNDTALSLVRSVSDCWITSFTSVKCFCTSFSRTRIRSCKSVEILNGLSETPGLFLPAFSRCDSENGTKDLLFWTWGCSKRFSVVVSSSASNKLSQSSPCSLKSGFETISGRSVFFRLGFVCGGVFSSPISLSEEIILAVGISIFWVFLIEEWRLFSMGEWFGSVISFGTNL